ncbi:hypothetical protein KU306_16755 (plasmid) [Haloferax larsenii]|uniref:Uncharacterized protein n=1 Tax=Haloferax larsenii TaxID=302484 RepID=A0ABY5RJ70_HALLR|nr:hypothetical protein [Haloferax larsenii]UVE51973.1 hypothetical protein KU306_16755 [Haloferax larsenii]
MPTEDDLDFPPQSIEKNGYHWERAKLDKNSYQWVREMSDDEYSWDLEDVSLVGTDVPIRAVSLQSLDGEWQVEASETAGPDYHRPGFTELISAEFSHSTSDLAEARNIVHQFINQLS